MSPSSLLLTLGWFELTGSFAWVPRISPKTSNGSLRPTGGAAVLRLVARVPNRDVVDVFEDIVREDDLGVG